MPAIVFVGGHDRAAPRPLWGRLLLSGLLLAGLARSAVAQDYYVDPVAGSDGQDNGQSAAAPFQTFAHAATVAGASDAILLKAGTVAREGAVQVNGCAVSAYGSGAPPIVTASVPLTTWTPWAGHAPIMTASVASAVQAVYCQGVLQTLARYPNADAADPWLHTGPSSTEDSIQDPTLAGDGGKWAGAEVRWRHWSWWFETRPIIADSGTGILTFSAASEQVTSIVSIDSGYYIDNALSALDEAGEWFWDSASSTLYFDPPSGANLAGGDVEVLTATTGITLSGGSMTGISLREFAGVALTTADHPCTVSHCSFSQIENEGIFESYNCGGSQFVDNQFTDIRNTGIYVVENPTGAHGTLIQGNTFERIGMIPGYGGSGSYHSNGITLNVGTQIHVTQNRLSDVGADGILLGAAGNSATGNILVRCMSTLNDGAAIYSDCNSSDIENNLIVFAIGNLVSCQPWTPLGHGIWCDDVGGPWTGTTIANNTVVGSGGYGLFFPHPDGSTVSGNILLGDQLGELLLNDDTAGGMDANPENITFTGNSLVGVAEPRFIAQPLQNLASWADQGPDDCVVFTDGVDYGAMSGSILDVPSGAPFANAGSSPFTTIASWQAGRTWVDPAPLSYHRDAVVVVNDTASAASVAPPAGSWINGSGAAVGAAVQLAPYTGALLMAAPGVSVATLPAVTTVSGIDYTQPDPFAAGGTATAGTATGTATSGAAGTTTASAAGGGTTTGAAAGSGGGGGGGGCGLGSSGALLMMGLAALAARRRQGRA